MEPGAVAMVAAALAAGGVLKGALGAGAPIFVIPVLAILYDVPFAIAIFSIPNLLSNGWQSWSYRRSLLARLGWALAISGAVGTGVGTVILTRIPGDVLLAGLAAIVFLYIALRLARPGWVLARGKGERYAGLAGFAAGVMQGAGGISAPVSITYLNAMRLDRNEFIATISLFFFAMSLVQIPTLAAYGILTPERGLLSLVASLPLFGAMPLGNWLGRRISKRHFDQFLLWVLAAIALKLIHDAAF